MVRKKILLKKYFPIQSTKGQNLKYLPQKKNDGTCNEPNPTKINPKYTHFKSVVKIDFGKKNLIVKIQ